MKKMIADRIVLLAMAQESMTMVADKMVQWDKSQLQMGKSAFDSMNISDHMLKLSREGSELIGRLTECCNALVKHPGEDEIKKLEAVLNEIQSIFNNISATSITVSEISHQIEGEAALQEELEEDIRQTLAKVNESLNSAIACAELVLAES